MAITSDITLNVSKFRSENVTESTKKAATLLENIITNGPRWWEIGIEKYLKIQKLRRRCLSPSISRRLSIALFLCATLAVRSPSVSISPIMVGLAKASSYIFIKAVLY